MMIAEKYRNIHATHAQNASQRGLGPYVHLQVPYEEYGQESKSHIAQCGGDTVDVGDVDDTIEIHAMAGNTARRVHLRSYSLPKERNRRALHGQHEEEDETNNGGHGDDDPQDNGMGFRNGETEKRNGDRDLCDCDDPDVGGLTEPPPLLTC